MEKKNRVLLGVLYGLFVALILFGVFFIGFNAGSKIICESSGGRVFSDNKCHGIVNDSIACNDIVNGYVFEKDLNMNFSGEVLI